MKTKHIAVKSSNIIQTLARTSVLFFAKILMKDLNYDFIKNSTSAHERYRHLMSYDIIIIEIMNIS
jgi:hypothetical protein